MVEKSWPVAERQMRELPYYNTFFRLLHVPAIDLSENLQISAADLNHVFMWFRFCINDITSVFEETVLYGHAETIL